MRHSYYSCLANLVERLRWQANHVIPFTTRLLSYCWEVLRPAPRLTVLLPACIGAKRCHGSQCLCQPSNCIISHMNDPVGRSPRFKRRGSAMFPGSLSSGKPVTVKVKSRTDRQIADMLQKTALIPFPRIPLRRQTPKTFMRHLVPVTRYAIGRLEKYADHMAKKPSKMMLIKAERKSRLKFLKKGWRSDVKPINKGLTQKFCNLGILFAQLSRATSFQRTLSIPIPILGYQPLIKFAVGRWYQSWPYFSASKVKCSVSCYDIWPVKILEAMSLCLK